MRASRTSDSAVAAPKTKSAGATWPVVGFFGLVLASGIVPSCHGVSSKPSAVPTLNVTPGRGIYCFSFTNQEPDPLAGCRLSITDSTGTQWTAASPRPVVPLETRAVEWADFRARGQQMPDGLRDQPITLSCLLPGQVRRSATFK